MLMFPIEYVLFKDKNNHNTLNNANNPNSAENIFLPFWR